MKTILCMCLILLVSCNNANGQEEALSKGAALLFKDTPSTMSNHEKNKIYELANFDIAENGTQFYFKGDTDGAAYPFDAYIYPLDINKDGAEDIGLVFGNSYTSGGAGVTSTIFIKNKSGSYDLNFGFPGNLVLMPSNHQGYPDTMIQGPGFEFAVWIWNGKEYVFKSNIKSTESDKLKTSTLEEASLLYLSSLKH